MKSLLRFFGQKISALFCFEPCHFGHRKAEQIKALKEAESKVSGLLEEVWKESARRDDGQTPKACPDSSAGFFKRCR